MNQYIQDLLPDQAWIANCRSLWSGLEAFAGSPYCAIDRLKVCVRKVVCCAMASYGLGNRPENRRV